MTKRAFRDRGRAGTKAHGNRLFIHGFGALVQIRAKHVDDLIVREIVARPLGQAELNQIHEVYRGVVTLQFYVPLGVDKPLPKVPYAERPIEEHAKVLAEIKGVEAGAIATASNRDSVDRDEGSL